MNSFARQAEALTTYTVRHAAQLVIAIALFGSLAAGLYWARRRCRALSASENANFPVLNTPIAAGLVLTLLFSGWIVPQPPRFLQAILGILALVPSVWIVRRLIPIEFRPLPYALLACFMLDEMRSITAAVEFLPPLVFLAEMLLMSGVAAWLIRCAGGRRRATRLKIAGYLVFAIALSAAIASAAGYTSLATLLGNALIRSSYLALILYAVLEVLDGLVNFALQMRPFDALAAIRRHRDQLGRQIRRGLQLIAILFWAFALVQQLLICGAND